jgi:aminoglycoside 3-N-acetyltransferase
MMPTISFTGSAAEHAARDPVFDARETPSMVGLITEAFRRSAGVVRSLHPTHSVAVWGNRAEAIITSHHLAETPCGRPTPYGKLLEYDGKILFAGVPVSTMTFIHFLEEEIEPQLPFPVFAAEKYALRWKDEAGAVGVSTTRGRAEASQAVARGAGGLHPFHPPAGTRRVRRRLRVGGWRSVLL